MENESYSLRLNQYLKERFNLFQFIPLSLILSGVLAVGSQKYLNTKIFIVPIVLSVIALFLFLLRLRIFDEFKDYEHDLKYYPERPVSRGLISKKELKCLLIFIIIIEMFIAYLSGVNSIILFAISFSYSLLMLKEFFLKKWIKDHFTVYIISHEILILPLFFYLCSINNFKIIYFGHLFFWFLVIYVGLSMFLLEVSRKFRSLDLEIGSRDTYTAQYGIKGATLLLLVISIFILISMYELLGFLNYSYLFAVGISLLVSVFFFWQLFKFNMNPTKEASKKVFIFSIYFVFVSCISLLITLLK